MRLISVFLVLVLSAASSAWATSPVYVHSNSSDCLGNGSPGTSCFNSLQEGINNATPPGPGQAAEVFVLTGTYTGGDISLMGSAVGGVTGDLIIAAFGDGQPSIEPPTGERGIWTSATSFNGDITLRGLRVTSPDRDAIHLGGIAGDITLDSLLVTDAGVDGADLRGMGAVTIVDSHFDGNRNDGVEMTVMGPVLIERSSANNNWDARTLPDGRQLTADGFNIEIINGSLTIIDSEANGNIGDGFEIHPTDGLAAMVGTITSVLIEGSTAMSNGLRGVFDGDLSNDYLDDYPEVVRGDGFQIESCIDDGGSDVEIGDPCVIGDVTIRDTITSDNSQDGIELIAYGTIVIDNLTSNNNGDLVSGDGIDMTGFFDGVTITNAIINDNADNGIQIEPNSSDDEGFDVFLANVTLINNGKGIPNEVWEIELPPQDPNDVFGGGNDGMNLDGMDNLTCINCTIIDSGDDGVDFRASESITVENLLALGNQEAGIELRSPGSVSCINCVSRDNIQDAFQVEARTVVMENCEASTSLIEDGIDSGDITLIESFTVRNCILDGNNEQGLVMEGDFDFAPNVLQALTIENVCAINNRTGLEPKGGSASITMNNVQAVDNTRYGIRFDSTTGTNTVSNSNFSGNGLAAMVLVEEDMTVAAGGNWWGDASGPQDAGDNPSGQGQPIWDATNMGGTGTVDFATPAAQPNAAASAVCERTIESSGTTVNFVSSELNATGMMSVTLSNPGIVPVVVLFLGEALAPFSNTGSGSCGQAPFAIAPGSSCTLEFGFTPTAPGSFSQVLELRSTADTAPDQLTLIGDAELLPVPTLNRWGVLMLALLALLLGGVYVRNQRKELS